MVWRALAGVAALTLVAWYALPFAVPLPAALMENPEASPVFTDRDGRVIARLSLPGAARCAPVDADVLPRDLVACTMAAEDKRFMEHGGVDLLATARAARDLVAQRRVVSGASTITQQLVKISSPPSERRPLRKVYEALAARRLEMTWNKQRIMTAYLNRLDYGNLRFGAAEAAHFYFQKPLADLSLAECALLAGLPQAPSRLNPIRHPQRALARREVVLRRLLANGGTGAARIESALTEPLVLRPLRETRPAPWLAALTPAADARQQADGHIATTLDLDIQRGVEAIVREETARLRDANLRHAAVVVIHNASGGIRALVSSADWNDPRGGQINGALAARSPGSALKPFTYLLAMERGGRIPSSILADIPSPFRTPEGVDLPQNYDRAYRGPVTLRAALACSLNVPALRELNSLGGPVPLHELLVTLGLTTLGDDPHAHGLGLTLGNAPVRLLELTNAYATLARGGMLLPASLFPMPESPEGKPLPFSAASFHLLADVLSDPAARAPAFPPGGPLDLPFRCAVKTGTSSDFRDNWCVGYTPEFTVGVWAGNFENQPMKGVSGVAGAGPVFNRTMRLAHAGSTPTWFARPSDLVEVRIDPRNGRIVSVENPKGITDLAPRERIPPAATPSDFDAEGRALLGPAYAAWYQGNHNLRRHELALDTAAVAMEPLRVITPAHGATLLLDPEIPSGSDRLRPVTNLPGTARWSSPTLRIEEGSPEPLIHLSPGTHTLTATDPRTGAVQHITLHVKRL
jgi:penicillin-binding protein 1C